VTPADHDEAIRGPRRRAVVVVAHPDDETLWCGGYMLAHPEFDWRVVTLCRASDPDRAPKFGQVMEQLGSVGEMADLDDEPDQAPLPIEQVKETIIRLLAGNSYSLTLTHGPKGEYTRHRRHEECSRSVVELWRSGGIATKRLWLFAYEDGGHAYLLRVRDDADRRCMLAEDIWLEKHFRCDNLKLAHLHCAEVTYSREYRSDLRGYSDPIQCRPDMPLKNHVRLNRLRSVLHNGWKEVIVIGTVETGHSPLFQIFNHMRV
jgi:hypothetical protein